MTSRQSPESGSRHGEFSVRDVVASYDVEARTLVPDYERLLFEKVHAAVLDRLPESTGCILDVGAGSGRDAAWFAAKGHKVVAVEPSVEMRTAGKERHKSPNIRWMADALPALDKVLRSKLTFDLIWLSAVWMHVPPNQRARALRKMVSVMSPGGSMMLSLRQGPPPPGRPMAPVTAAEVEMLARRYGLQTIRIERHPDAAGRIGISWEIIWLRLPDDGTGALPLLRHVVFNDQKSSTYKLALLRSLIRIADSAGGFARPGRDEQLVDLPLGLVALFWIRAFQPLIAKSFAQHPAGNGRLAFVKDGFRGLRARSAHDLRVGQQFTGDDARNLILAIRDAAGCIRNMPATYIKYPGSSEPVFSCARTPVRIRDTVRVDDAFLWSFGTFSVPVGLWHRPADDAPCAGIEDHGQKQKPRPGRDIGDIGHVELIGLSGHEVALNQIRRRPRIGSSSGRCDPLAPADTIEPRLTHQPRHALTPDPPALIAKLSVDARRSIRASRLTVDRTDALQQHLIGHTPRRG